MNRFLHFLGIIGTMIMIICDIAEFLAVPALFIVIGLLNSYPWQYYAISIGGYIVLFIVAEIIAHFVFKTLNKKYSPLIERKLEKYLNKFSNKGWFFIRHLLFTITLVRHLLSRLRQHKKHPNGCFLCCIDATSKRNDTLVVFA